MGILFHLFDTRQGGGLSWDRPSLFCEKTIIFSAKVDFIFSWPHI